MGKFDWNLFGGEGVCNVLNLGGMWGRANCGGYDIIGRGSPASDSHEEGLKE